MTYICFYWGERSPVHNTDVFNLILFGSAGYYNETNLCGGMNCVIIFICEFIFVFFIIPSLSLVLLLLLTLFLSHKYSHTQMHTKQTNNFLTMRTVRFAFHKAHNGVFLSSPRVFVVAYNLTDN